MRNVGAHILDDKMDEAVTQYINAHHPNEHPVHVNSNGLALNVQDDAVGRVTVMHSQTFTSPLCRQVSVGEQVSVGPWQEELIDTESRIAAIVAQLSQHTRPSHHQTNHHKVTSVRNYIDPSVILDGSMRLLSSQSIDQHQEQIVVQLPPLPPLHDMKRCPDADWFNNKSRSVPPLKVVSPLLEDSQSPELDIEASQSPIPTKQPSKKSLPHKKRISRKLKKNGSTLQQDIVVLTCSDDTQHEEILPDNFVTGVQHQQPVSESTHITHQVRPILVCSLCGEFYGEEQLKFYHHLKQHYEPHDAIIIENAVPDLAIDKMTNTCIVDNVATLPDSIVELSLENTVPKIMYQNIDKQVLYSSSDKSTSYTSNRAAQYSIEKETTSSQNEADKGILYDMLTKSEWYSCMKCNKSFRKQKQCEAHIKEMHPNTKSEDMGEFSEPEDLMEGIHVSVEDGGEHYEHSILPHLTVENGHVHQEHVKHWYLRCNSNSSQVCGSDNVYCPVCPASGAQPRDAPHDPPHEPPHDPPHDPSHESPQNPQHNSPQALTHSSLHDTQPLKVLKEEVLQGILQTDASRQMISENIIPETETLPAKEQQQLKSKVEKKKSGVKYECPQCGRDFKHRSSLLYHILSHGTKQQICKECGKSFYTASALKIHKRVHNGDRPYKCDDCGRDFRQWSDLKYHKVIHTNQKRFKCEFCGKEFARKYSLNVHRRIHTGERNYKCDYCPKTFSASSYRLTHMKVHTGDRPHKCDQCNKSFRVAFDLRRHILTHEKQKARIEQLKVKSESMFEVEVNDDYKFKAKNQTKTTPVKLDKKLKVVKKNVKKGAPNVTVSNNNGQFKVEHPNIQVFDSKQEASGKYKEAYSEIVDYNKDIEFKIIYKENDEKDFTTLKPLYRNAVDSEKLVYGRTENTDGKLQIYTQVEKNKEYSGPIVVNNQVMEDAKIIEREIGREIRNDANGDVIENVFFERLNPFYNIPTV